MNFVIAQIIEGLVIANGWWSPSPGRKVYLTKSKNALLVHMSPDDAVGHVVSYTWPRNRCNVVAGRMAWEHYTRKTSL